MKQFETFKDNLNRQSNNPTSYYDLSILENDFLHDETIISLGLDFTKVNFEVPMSGITIFVTLPIVDIADSKEFDVILEWFRKRKYVLHSILEEKYTRLSKTTTLELKKVYFSL